MDPLKLARLLQPLMPKQVERWMRIRETADPELQTLIDNQIQAALEAIAPLELACAVLQPTQPGREYAQELT